MLKLALSGIAAGLALFCGLTAASAASPVSMPISVSGKLVCPTGSHLGTEGKYCWPNLRGVCAPGYHQGTEGKYCWRNK